MPSQCEADLETEPPSEPSSSHLRADFAAFTLLDRVIARLDAMAPAGSLKVAVFFIGLAWGLASSAVSAGFLTDEAVCAEAGMAAEGSIGVRGADFGGRAFSDMRASMVLPDEPRLLDRPTIEECRRTTDSSFSTSTFNSALLEASPLADWGDLADLMDFWASYAITLPGVRSVIELRTLRSLSSASMAMQSWIPVADWFCELAAPIFGNLRWSKKSVRVRCASLPGKQQTQR